MFRISVDNQTHQVPDGLSILEVLRSIGAAVPTLCHDERLKPIGGCRLCIVQVEGGPRPVTACNTPIADGMEILTRTPEIESCRRTLLTLLARRYPARPFHRFPDKEFHRYIRAYGLEHELLGASEPGMVDDSHPYIHVDMSQCVTCFRCVRICEELQGQFVWKVWNRGDATRIVPDSGTTLRASSCVGCGACVDACPTGAIEDKSVLAAGAPAKWGRTLCSYCGTGCEMNVGTRDGRIIQVKPVSDAPVSHGHLCVKGRYSFGFVNAGDRVTDPMIREKDRWKKVSWEEAIEYTASSLRRILERRGPDSTAVLGSARATNEENYLAQKFARVVLGTNNVDCCARVCHAPSATALKTMLGAGAGTNSFADIEKARTILLCGANATENHPIVGARIKQAVLHGAHLIVIDPRQIELAHYSDHHLAVRPGTNIPLLNAMASAIVEEGLFDEGFLRERASDWEAFRDFIREWSPERAAAICGIGAGLIRKAARLYAVEKPAMCFHGLGMTEHVQGTEGVMALVNLALLTGNIGKPGTGINPLRGQNNVQGAAHMGCEPGSLTGSLPIKTASDFFEGVWSAPIPIREGLNLLEMMEAAAQGRLRALWAIGYDVFLTNANAHFTRRALREMELIIVQDIFLNETAKEFGTVFFPAASSFEKNGTFMNAERRIQRVRKVMEPLGRSKPDWEIICDMARGLGKGELFHFHSPEEIWNEIRAVWKAGSGITYEGLEEGGLQWPCPEPGHPGTEVLHTERFSGGPRAALRLIHYTPTPEITNSEFPFLLITGRGLYQFNAGTMTRRSPNNELRPADVLDISPEDARRLGLREGERFRVRSRYGDAILPIHRNPSVQVGQLFTTFHTPEVFLNYVTSSQRDNRTGTPEYKVTAVRIEKV